MWATCSCGLVFFLKASSCGLGISLIDSLSPEWMRHPCWLSITHPPPPTCYESLPNPRLDSDRPPQLKKVPPSFPFFFFSYFFINIFQFYPSLSFPFSEILLGFAGPLGPESARILFPSTYGFRFVSVTSTLYGSHPTWTSMLEEKNQREIYFLSK